MIDILITFLYGLMIFLAGAAVGVAVRFVLAKTPASKILSVILVLVYLCMIFWLGLIARGLIQ